MTNEPTTTHGTVTNLHVCALGLVEVFRNAEMTDIQRAAWEMLGEATRALHVGGVAFIAVDPQALVLAREALGDTGGLTADHAANRIFDSYSARVGMARHDEEVL